MTSTAKAVPTFYDLLEVEPDATPEQIKSAYRRLVVELHPDRNPGDEAVEERFKQITEAYDTLSDYVKRRDYDAKLERLAEEEAERFAARPPILRLSTQIIDFGNVLTTRHTESKSVQLFNDGGDCYIEISPDHGTIWEAKGNVADDENAIASYVFTLNLDYDTDPGDYSSTVFITLSNGTDESTQRLTLRAKVLALPKVNPPPTPPPTATTPPPKPTAIVPPTKVAPAPTAVATPAGTVSSFLSAAVTAGLMIVGIPLFIAVVTLLAYTTGLAQLLNDTLVKNQALADHGTSITPNLIVLGMGLCILASMAAILPGIYWAVQAVREPYDQVRSATLSIFCFVAFGVTLASAIYSYYHQATLK